MPFGIYDFTKKQLKEDLKREGLYSDLKILLLMRMLNEILAEIRAEKLGGMRGNRGQKM